ncbi:MAG TPA: PAS domain S-box protein, partial [Desulfobacterales bacterium]|nr:PAS domain S-box protein [Desulfobacterales bacterium]
FLELISTNGFVEKFEVQMKKKDGSFLWASVNASLSKDQEGNVIGVEGIARDITNRKQAEEALKKSEERYRAIAENSRVGFLQTTLDGRTIYINPAMCRMLEIEDPEELHGMTYDSFYDQNFYEKKSWQIIKNELVKREKGISSSYEIELTGKKGTKRTVMVSGAPIFLSEDKIKGSIATFIDITDKKKAEKALMIAHAELEHRVKERTRELEIKTQNLEETNIALKVLLDKRQDDKKETSDNLLTNVKELIAPYLEKIKKTKLDEQQKAIVSIIESSLNEITSPFARKMSQTYLNLTQVEIKVANLIRHGSNSKEISEIMNLSPRTIYNHRKNIRKKLGLEDRKTNLRSHLLSIH